MQAKSDERGFTLLETVISLTIFAGALIVAVQAVTADIDTQNYLTRQDVLGEQLRRCSVRVAKTLRSAGNSTIKNVPSFPLSSKSIRYRRLIDYDLENGPIWGEEERLSLQTQNQEGFLVWESKGRQEMWCTNVADVSFARQSRSVLMTLVCEDRGPKGEIIRVERGINVSIEN